MLAVLFARAVVYADPATYRKGRRRPVWIGVFLPVQCVIGALIRPTDRAVAKGCGAMVTPASSLDPAADEPGKYASTRFGWFQLGPRVSGRSDLRGLGTHPTCEPTSRVSINHGVNINRELKFLGHPPQ